MSAPVGSPAQEWELSHGLEAVPQSRRLARGWLAGWQAACTEAAGNIVLALSELVANAVEHGAAPIVLRLAAERQGADVVVTAVVHDASTRMPRVYRADGLEERYRGLLIVEAVTGKWGVRDAADGGKDVWCQVTVPGTGWGGSPADAARSLPLPERSMAAVVPQGSFPGGVQADGQPDVAWPSVPAASRADHEPRVCLTGRGGQRTAAPSARARAGSNSPWNGAR